MKKSVFAVIIYFFLLSLTFYSCAPDPGDINPDLRAKAVVYLTYPGIGEGHRIVRYHIRGGKVLTDQADYNSDFNNPWYVTLWPVTVPLVNMYFDMIGADNNFILAHDRDSRDYLLSTLRYQYDPLLHWDRGYWNEMDIDQHKSTGEKYVAQDIAFGDDDVYQIGMLYMLASNHKIYMSDVWTMASQKKWLEFELSYPAGAAIDDNSRIDATKTVIFIQDNNHFYGVWYNWEFYNNAHPGTYPFPGFTDQDSWPTILWHAANQWCTGSYPDWDARININKQSFRAKRRFENMSIETANGIATNLFKEFRQGVGRMRPNYPRGLVTSGGDIGASEFLSRDDFSPIDIMFDGDYDGTVGIYYGKLTWHIDQGLFDVDWYFRPGSEYPSSFTEEVLNYPYTIHLVRPSTNSTNKSITSFGFDYGEFWQPRQDAAAGWVSVASSWNGIKLAAASYHSLGAQIYTSTDTGVTWTPISPFKTWYTIASSSNGNKLVAGAASWSGSEYLYTSTDSGLTWTSNNATLGDWQAVASSADGTKLVAVPYSGDIYTSSDSGATWTPHSLGGPMRIWSSVASSADGSRLIAAAYDDKIYTSANSGASWFARENNRSWRCVASSADGMKLVACEGQSPNPGQIYTSDDSGVSWTPHETNRYWSSVASSADGTKLVAVVENGRIYTSTDAGTNWTAHETNHVWISVASSYDGTKVVACTTSKIYTSSSVTAVISEAAKTITLSVPAGTDLSNKVAQFTTSGDSVYVGSTPQVSGVTPNDFSSPVVYSVIAQDGTTNNYTVTVTTY